MFIPKKIVETQQMKKSNSFYKALFSGPPSATFLLEYSFNSTPVRGLKGKTSVS